jgi:hypothetical protein
LATGSATGLPGYAAILLFTVRRVDEDGPGVPIIGSAIFSIAGGIFADWRAWAYPAMAWLRVLLFETRHVVAGLAIFKVIGHRAFLLVRVQMRIGDRVICGRVPGIRSKLHLALAE